MRAIVMLYLMLTAASAWAGTLVDDFSDGDFEGWTQSGAGIWSVENEELVFESRSSSSILFIGESDWEDYTISVNAKLVKHHTSNWAEAIVLTPHGESIFRCYFFLMGTWIHAGKQVDAFRSQWGQVNNRIFKVFTWDMDTWYHLEVMADGDRFQFYVDDKLVIEYRDPVFDTGKAGFGGCYLETTIHFDDVVITGDDVPDMDMNLFVEDTDFSVEPKAKYTTTWAAIKYQ